MHTIDWLLEEDAPGVEMLARTRLLGESAGSRRIRAIRPRLNRYPPVAEMIGRLDEPVVGRFYKKYEGGYWTLIFLGEMQANVRARAEGQAIRRLADRVLSQQLANGGYSPNAKSSFEIVCLTANVLRSLTHFGYGDHEAVQAGYGRLAERILGADGVPCLIIDNYTLLDDCKMTLPQTLRAIAKAPASMAADLDPVRRLLIEKMLEVKVYRYVRSDTARFRRDLVPLRPKGMSQARFTREYRESHPVDPEDLVPKKGWLRFGFPHSYNSDLLEAMLALAEAGATYDPIMDEALDHIESKRDPQGRWKMENSLNGKMLSKIEKRGRPSKWITLQAMDVLQHFGRMRV